MHLAALLRSCHVDDAFGKSRVRVHPVSIKRRRNSVTRSRPPPFLRRMLRAEESDFLLRGRTVDRVYTRTYISSHTHRTCTRTSARYISRVGRRGGKKRLYYILQTTYTKLRGAIDKFSLSFSLPIPVSPPSLPFHGERVLFFRTVQFTVGPFPPSLSPASLFFFFNNKRRIFYHFFCLLVWPGSRRRVGEQRSIECARMADKNFRRHAIMQRDRTFYYPENIIVVVELSAFTLTLFKRVFRVNRAS